MQRGRGDHVQEVIGEQEVRDQERHGGEIETYRPLEESSHPILSHQEGCQGNGHHPAETEGRPNLILIQQNGQQNDGKKQGYVKRAFRPAQATEIPNEQIDRGKK